ncbi:PQQ-binding-like beta-propeller repeat protein [Rhodobacteraceae bacterium SC52]|nr:PQQ-binding-like beta-propeller repeat protein [Rhodobacteraceae bacterium SC52]
MTLPSMRLWFGLIFGSALLLASCSPPEEILPGQRFDPRDIAEASEAFDPEEALPTEPLPQPPTTIAARGYVVTGEPARLSLPAARTNSDWTHIGGSATHQIRHPSLGATLTQVWTAQIGQAASRRVRPSADPVVSGGRVFTLSAFSEVQATSVSGAVLWSRDLTPSGERPGEAAGGGLSIQGNRLYVTTGYGRLHVLDATSGAEVWTQVLDAVPNSAATVADKLVYVTTRGGEALALDTDTGRILWRLSAGDATSFTADGASPAVSGRTVLLPFGSGDVIAALRLGGMRLWSTVVTGERVGRAYARITDITGDPVIDGGTAYIGTPTGRLAAIDMATGERLWTANEGAANVVWPAGGSLFMITDQRDLARLSASDGSTIWSGTLPLYVTEKVRRRRGVFAHYGPVLAGGRLIVVSSDGFLREFNPTSGALLRNTDLGSPAVANPVVAGGTLFVVTENGILHAFR